MSSLVSSLPSTSKTYDVFRDFSKSESDRRKRSKRDVDVPPYGKRKNFVPQILEDYGDGGAYPEIHIAQYPLNMGRAKGTSSTSVISTDTSAETGAIEYDGVITQGMRENQIVQTKFTDMIEKNIVDDEDLMRPSEEETKKLAEETRNAIMKAISKKVAKSKPLNPGGVQERKEKFVRYTPRTDAPGYNPNIKQRIIRMVEAQVDPMEPPKFRHKKVPGGPPSPPVPIMHSPDRKVTKEEWKNWQIPPCISNWKNARGYTIPLDKRLAADGRGLQETTVNSKFAKFAESLYIAERKAREEVETRAALARKARMSAKANQEEELRRIAEQARQAHASLSRKRPRDESSSDSGSSGSDSDSDEEESRQRRRDDDDDEARRRRDRIRAERKRERERDLRLEALGKRSKTMRDLDRDVSERVALGLPTGKQKTQTQYDTRLFNRSEGMDSGFGRDDEYNLYSKPLFNKGAGDQIYRPRKSAGDVYGTTEEHLDTIRSQGERFKPDRDFAGVADAREKGFKRDGPVQFERRNDVGKNDEDDEADPFGLDTLLNEAKKKS
eukprot:g5070.t1